MAQAFFEAREDGGVRPSFGIDHPVGVEPDLGKRGGEQIPAVETPKDGAVGTGQDAGRELSGGSAVQGAVAAPCNLMEGPKCQPTARQTVVYLCQPEWQKPARNPASRLDPADLFPK